VQQGKPREWAEELPSNCPPDEAFPPNYDIFYRLVEGFPPKEEDFFSHRKLYPKKKFPVNECQARSVSLFNRLDECAKIQKLPAHKNKKIVKLTLPPESGVVLQTGQNRAHYSWWLSKQYDPIPACEIVNP
jgi:hypothetical protein